MNFFLLKQNCALNVKVIEWEGDHSLLGKLLWKFLFEQMQNVQNSGSKRILKTNSKDQVEIAILRPLFVAWQ